MKKLFLLPLLLLLSIFLSCATSLPVPTENEVIIYRGKRQPYFPDISAEKITFNDFICEPFLSFGCPRFDLFRQTVTKAEVTAAPGTNQNKVELKEKPVDYEIICISLGCGIYIDIAGNVFLNPIEHFGISSEVKITDKANLTDKNTYTYENNQLYLKKQLLVSPGQDEGEIFISHGNGIFGKKLSVLRQEDGYFVFEKKKGLSTDIPVKFRLENNVLSMSSSFMKIKTEYKVVNEGKRIDVFKNDRLLVTVAATQDMLIVCKDDFNGKSISFKNDVLTVTEYGNQ